MRNYLIKNIPICFEMIKLKRRSLNYKEVCTYPHTFASGEGGPRGAVDEEDTIPHHKRQEYKILIKNLGYFEAETS